MVYAKFGGANKVYCGGFEMREYDNILQTGSQPACQVSLRDEQPLPSMVVDEAERDYGYPLKAQLF